MSKYLIVAPSWVGDTILAQPLFAALKRAEQDALVHVLAPKWCGAVLARMPEVDSIIESPFAHGDLKLFQRWKLAQALKRERFTDAIVLPNSFKSALIPFFARIPRRIGYLGEQRYGLLTHRRILDEKVLPRLVDRFLALINPSETISVTPRLKIDQDARLATLRRLHLSTQRPVAILCPGAEYGPAKRWPVAYFAELALKLHHDGYSIWLVGSANDQPLGEAIHREALYCRDLCGLTTLTEALDLISFATVVIANDSGLMHAAAALGTPVVALFGSSSPVYTPPLSPKAQIARLDLPCSPCFQRDCPLGHLNCLRELKPEPIYHLVRESVSKEERAPALTITSFHDRTL